MSETGIGPQGKASRKPPRVMSAGWYPDPLGLDGERYWDGANWTEKFVPATVPRGKFGTGAKVALVVIAALVGVVCVVVLLVALAGGSGPKNTGDLSREVIDTCQDAIRNGLKDPDSAKFYGWTAQEAGTAAAVPPSMKYDPGAGDRHWIASGDVNAKNSFGGYNGRTTRTCDVVITTDGYAHAQSQRD